MRCRACLRVRALNVVAAFLSAMACKPPLAGPVSVEVAPAPAAAHRHADTDATAVLAPVTSRAIATAWLDALRRRDIAALAAHTRYPFEFRDRGTAGRPGAHEIHLTADSPQQLGELISPLFADNVLTRTMKGERNGRVESRTDLPDWAEPWQEEQPRSVDQLRAYFSADDAAFSLILFVDESGVHAVWKRGFDASVEVDLALHWLEALRQRDMVTLQHLTSYPFELRDSEVQAHCGARTAASPKQLPKAMDCLLSDPILIQALSRGPKVEAGLSPDDEPGVFKGWRRPEHADLWSATSIIFADGAAPGSGNEYDLCLLIAKNGVRVFWKRGSIISGD
jgi:hypothetical protein